MTKFQKIMISMMAIVLVIACGLGGLVLYDRLKPSREEQLAEACETHPQECEKMRMVHSATEAAVAEAQQYGPAMASEIAELRKVQRDYDDRFIAEGYYGDPKPAK